MTAGRSGTGRGDGVREPWAPLLAIGLLLLAALLPLGPVIQGGDWWITAVVAIASVLVPAGIVRSVGGATWVGTLVGIGVWILGLVLFFAPGSAVLGLIPTPDTVSAFQELAVQAGQSLYVQSVPVEPIAPLLFLLAVGLGAVAALADVVGVSLRSPALVGILAVGLVVPPSIFSGEIDLVAYVAVGVAFLLVLRVSGRRPSAPAAAASSRASALVVGAAAVAVTVVAATLVPAFSSSSIIRPGGDASGSGVSELADLGRDLQRPGNRSHFTYQTTSPVRQYLRLLTLDRFEGTQWSASGDHPTTEQSDGERVVVPGLSGEVAAEEETVEVQIAGLVGDLLPVPFPSVAIDGLDGEWEWDTDGLTVSSGSSSVEGQEYTVTSLLLEPTAEQLRSAPADYPSEVTPFLELPDEVPDRLRAVFDEVTAGTTTGYDAAFAIQQYLREDFSYSVSTPVQDGYDGDGFEAIADFLEERSGYCVHFASAMAILTRMAGIPSRVSLGYLPGDRVGSNDDGVVGYRVGSDDLHAWPELYFAGVGWVPFEPTPGRGSVPAYAVEASDAPEAEDVPEATATRTPSATPAPTATTEADGSASSADRDTPVTLGAVAGSALIVVLLALLLLPAGVRMVRRGRRRAEAASGGTAAPLWDELVDTAVDLGHAVAAADSERDLAGRLRGALQDDPSAREAIDRLLAATERERYADRTGRTTVARGEDLDVALDALRSRSSVTQRILSIMAPASVLRPSGRRRSRAAAG
jgi:transglutaminase-like putative cysteine protease